MVELEIIIFCLKQKENETILLIDKRCKGRQTYKESIDFWVSKNSI